MRFGPACVAVVALAVLVGVTAAGGSAASEAGALSGTWTGVLHGSVPGSPRERIVLAVNARETAGTWSVSATCHGTLTLDSISGGYHHYRRRVASGTSCLGGDVDCLMRVGARLYDSVTPRPGGVALNGTLRSRATVHADTVG